MPDYQHVFQLIEAARRQLDEVASEIETLQSRDAAVERALRPESAPGGKRRFFDPARVVPPTQTDDPDSIVGGVPTREFPDCCAVGNATQFYCTGTLIAPTLIVTARHCPDLKRAFLKGYDITDPAGGEVIEIAEEFANEEADLRVLVLRHASSVAPRHVAQGGEVRAQRALLVGFGAIDFGGTVGYGVKRKVEGRSRRSTVAVAARAPATDAIRAKRWSPAIVASIETVVEVTAEGHCISLARRGPTTCSGSPRAAWEDRAFAATAESTFESINSLIGSIRKPALQFRDRWPEELDLVSHGNHTALTIVEGANRLGVRLFLELCRNRPGRNTVVSPQGLAAALFLLHSSATGDTRTQLAHALGIGDGKPEELDRLHLPLVHASDADRALRLTSAVSLWARRSLRLKSAFLRESQTIGADVRLLDLDDLNAYDAINDWVCARTNGQINHLIGSGEIAPGTMLLILTALYFKGQWGQPFDPSQTQMVFFNLADGTAERLPMMRRTATFLYGEIEPCQVVELPFGSGRVCLRVFLPAAPHVSENRIGSALVQRFHLPERLGEVALPRWEVDATVDLAEALTAVGMGVIFSPEAQFGHLSDNAVWVGRVKQRVTVKLDEEGTEAAAAMSIQFIRTVAPRFTFVADRPFYWTIRDKESNLLMLIGFVANPSDH